MSENKYEMCEHGRHIGAVCLPCAEKEMIYDKALETGFADYYNSRHIPEEEYVDPYPNTTAALNEELLPEAPWPEKEYVDPFDMKPEPVDEVHSPEHYTVGGYETIDVIEAKLTPEEVIGGLKWQIMKYILRANYKGHHDQDCEKAAWYANRLIKYLEKQKNAKSVDKKG